MGKRKKRHKPVEEEAPPPVEAAPRDPDTAELKPPAAGEDEQGGREGGGGALVETPEAAVVRLTEELDSQKDRYLRLAAEFDNFRKRMVRERTEARARAQADLAANLLESLDDLSRVAALDPAQSSMEDVVAGVGLVERKLLRELQNQGLQRIGNAGEQFDPNDHEAVATAPAPAEEQENQVAAVLQVGYRLGSMLLRPARVQVFVAPPTGGEPEA
ncbi:MAG: nucleotide exchange factor GrpE [Gemmatimonadota bacterium]|nr:MAG: nucleotide exchange factor GrpE [Gemmatimonadota bacterium]